MTRDQVGRILREMEQIRMDSYEAETEAQERRLDREYGRLWKIIEPYVTGATPYTEARANPNEQAAWASKT